jgi:hypothetical protein
MRGSTVKSVEWTESGIDAVRKLTGAMDIKHVPTLDQGFSIAVFRVTRTINRQEIVQLWITEEVK